MTREVFANEIEDLISKYSKNPAKLQKEISSILENNPEVGVYLDSMEDYAVPFGDVRILQIIRDLSNGQPLDSGYIQSLDFSEDDYDEKFEPTSKEVDNKMGRSTINFRKLLVEPMFISDWPHHKHEMVGHFELPLIETDDIVENGRISELCDSVTISLISNLQKDLPSVPAGLNIGELEKYFEDNPSEFATALKELSRLQGPSIEDYLDFAGTVLEPAVTQGLTEHPEELPPRMKAELDDVLIPDSLARLANFAEAVTDKGRMYNLLRSSKKNMITPVDKDAEANSRELEKFVKRYKDYYGVDSGDSDRYPVQMVDVGHQDSVSFSQFSEALMQSGDCIGHEEFIAPEHREVYEKMKADGIIRPVKATEPVLSEGKAILIIMEGHTPEERIEKFKGIQGQLKPGDFVNLYNFSKNFAETQNQAAVNLAKSLASLPPTMPIFDDTERYSDKQRIPTGDAVDKPGRNNPNFK